jgi:hypothetical protein
MYRCSKCGQPWDDGRARDNDLTCTRRCGGPLFPVAPLALPDLEGCDLGRLPYPVALAAQHLASALQTSGDVLAQQHELGVVGPFLARPALRGPGPAGLVAAQGAVRGPVRAGAVPDSEGCQPRRANEGG